MILLAGILLAAGGCGSPSADRATDSAAEPTAGPAAANSNSRTRSPRTESTGGFASDAATASSPSPRPSLRRAVIRNAELGVRVDDLTKAESMAADTIQSVGGYIDTEESSDLAGKHPVLTLTARVPEVAFERTVKAFESLGTRLAKRLTARDVTSEIADQGARISTLRAHEESLRNMLRQARDASSIMEAQRRLSDVRAEIEGMEASLASVQGLAKMATIRLRLEQSAEALPAKDPRWANEAWAAATGSAASTFRGAATVAMWALVYSPIWLLALAVFRNLARLRRPSETAHPGSG